MLFLLVVIIGVFRDTATPTVERPQLLQGDCKSDQKCVYNKDIKRAGLGSRVRLIIVGGIHSSVVAKWGRVIYRPVGLDQSVWQGISTNLCCNNSH